MKILLMPPIGANKFIQYPSIGLGYIATALEKYGHSVNTFGFRRNEYSIQLFKHFLSNYKPDIVGITIISKDIQYAKNTLETIKKLSNRIITIVGGPHPSGEPVGIMKELPLADFAIQGEGENSLPQLIDLICKNETTKSSFKDISGLVWREENKILVNKPIFTEDIDSFGMPKWSLMPPEESDTSSFNFFYKNHPIAPISITRGCPFSCTFCAASVSNGKKVRKRSISNVIKEIKYLYHNHGVREIQIIDSNFTFDPILVKSFCAELLNSSLQISWSCPNGVRLDSLNEEIVQLMKKSGCYLLNVGVETGSAAIMKSIKKKIDCSYIADKVNLLKKHKILVVGYFMFGFPNETIADINQTIDLSLKLNLDGASYSILMPLPGTEIYKQIINKKKEINFIWSNFDFAHFSGIDYSVPFDKLMKIRKKAYLQFYFRPKQIFNLIKFNLSFDRIILLIKFVNRVLSSVPK